MLKAGTAARRISVQWDAPVAPEVVRGEVERWLQQLDRRLQARDATWVGHCKLLIASERNTVYASLTAADDEPRWAGTLGELDAAELTIYVALYSWSDADVAQALDGLLAEEAIFSTASGEMN